MPDGAYAAARQSPHVRLAGRYSSRARRRRYLLFRQAVELKPGDTILDLGCGELGLGALNRENPITGFDLIEQPDYIGDNRVRFVRGDAIKPLEFDEGEFDVVFSNSLIEHLPLAGHATFASEARRVGKRYFIQTPARGFPIEPHYLMPFVQFMPTRWAQRLARFGPEGGPPEPIHLLSRRELQALFPGGQILTERFGPLPKSYMAAGRGTAG